MESEDEIGDASRGLAPRQGSDWGCEADIHPHARQNQIRTWVERRKPKLGLFVVS